MAVTADEARPWSEALTLLSLNRFAPRFTDLGLPEAIGTNPSPVSHCARTALREATPGTGPAVFFACVAGAYGDATAAAVRRWGERFVVTEVADSLTAWEQLLRRLCGLVTDDGLTVVVPEQVRPTAARLCDSVSKLLARSIAELDPGGEPVTPWEEELDARVRRAAGDAPDVLGPIETSRTSAQLILRRKRTDDALTYLVGELSQDDRTRLVGWGQEQGEQLGIPRAIVEPAIARDV
jgi:hypothetical protein